MKPIDFDVTCVSCKYNLRGRIPLGRCPECGTPIGATINAISRRERPEPWFEHPWRRGGALVVGIGLLVVTYVYGPNTLTRVASAIGLDLLTAGLLALVVSAMLSVPARWFFSVVAGIASGLVLGTALHHVVPTPCVLGPVLLFAVPAVFIRYDLHLEVRDLLWFWPLLCLFRAAQLAV